MTRPSPVTTYALAAAAFLVVLMLLAWQVRAGRDPAIGAAKPKPAKRVVVVKRIERKVIITAPAVAAAPRAAGGSARAASAPVAASAALPAPAAPAPAPAAPAPVVATRSS